MSSGDRFICGIEIHQQLNTRKLFCSCESELSEESTSTYFRRLRPTAGESGVFDRAAVAEAKKQLGFRYQLPPRVSCLGDIDEEPPGAVSEDALDVVLTFAAMVNAKIIDEIYYMRKIVVDGSGPSGYQRTAMVAVDGHIDINGKTIKIETICLEEDSARKVEEKDGEVTYRLDRLGIPLIEIATGPDIRTPEEAMEVALRIGMLLRATKRVKRGIGTIREDINISLPGSARTEIKGAQDLRLLPTYVENEVQRHAMLLKIREILLSRDVSIGTEITDVTDIFKDCPSNVIKSALSGKGKVLAIKLGGFAGVLNGSNGTLRLGSEMAQRARTKGVKGIFHSDELPAYGIEQGYVDRLKERLGLKEDDAFVMCAEKEKKAKDALEAAAERAKDALIGVPEETRDPQPDGTSRYMRPLPGAARMYPETDVPPILITPERLKRIYDDLPELPGTIEKRLVSEYGINAQQARQIVREGNEELFERIAKDKSMAAVAATTFLNTFPEIEREGIDISKISDDDTAETFLMLKASKFSKEALPSVFREIAKGMTPAKAVSSLGLATLSREDAAKAVASIVKEREQFVKEKGMAAVGPLMAPVMEALRGKIDGKIASELLTEEIRRLV